MLDDAAGAPGESPTADGPAAPGDQVEVPHLGLKGSVIAVDGQQATVSAGAVTVKVPLKALRPGASPSPGMAAGKAASGSAPVPAMRGTVRAPDKGGVEAELRLIGRSTDDARSLLEKYLDDAFLAGLTTVRIIHGKGTGALRRTVQEILATHPLVAQHRPGSAQEGGEGATIAGLHVA